MQSCGRDEYVVSGVSSCVRRVWWFGCVVVSGDGRVYIAINAMSVCVADVVILLNVIITTIIIIIVIVIDVVVIVAIAIDVIICFLSGVGKRISIGI